MLKTQINILAGDNSGIWTIVIILIIIIVLASAGYFWFRYLTKRQRFQRAILELDHRKKVINDLPVGFKLLKLENIGTNNVVYAEVHREYKKKYDDLIEEFNKDFDIDYAVCERLLNEKNYRKLGETLQLVSKKISTYEERMKQLSEQISSITKDEDETKDFESKLKSRNRECYEQYQQNRDNLDILKDEFKKSFKKIDDRFLTYDDYIVRGNFTDAKEILMMINDSLNEIEKQLLYAPKYTIVLTRDIPNEINQIIDKYNDMRMEGYPLFHILANVTINDIKEDLTKAVIHLKSFEYAEIDNIIEDIHHKMKELDDQLEVEIKAKEEFDNKSKEYYDEAEGLERYYIKHIKENADIRKIYVVDEKQSELESRFKVEVQKLSAIRSGMDSLNYGNQAYSTRVTKLNELIKQVNTVQEYKNTITNNITTMRDNSEDAYNLITDGACKLKNLEIDVRNSRVDKIVQRFADDFADGRYIIEKLESLLNTVPIEVEKVQYYSNSLTNLIDRLKVDIKKQIANAKYAEKLIMYASSLKNVSGGDKMRNISKAELYYYDGKYEDAIKIALSSVDNLPKFLEKGPTIQ